MFVQVHHMLYQRTLQETAHTSSHLQGFEHIAHFAKNQYLSRIIPAITAIKDAVFGASIAFLKGSSELFISVVNLDLSALKHAGIYFLSAIVDAIALPILGLLTLISPTKSLPFTLSGALAEFNSKWVVPNSYYLYDTQQFNPFAGRVAAPIRGFVEASCGVALATSEAVNQLLSWPTNQMHLLGIVQKMFRGAIDDNYSYSMAAVKLFAGLSGPFSRYSRNHINIFINGNH